MRVQNRMPKFGELITEINKIKKVEQVIAKMTNRVNMFAYAYSVLYHVG